MMNGIAKKAMSSSSKPLTCQRIKAILFDVDDTLYDISTGFTANRNGETIQDFMIEKLGFPDRATAKALRDDYFSKYHSSMKALTVAQQDGKLVHGGTFRKEDLNDWFAEHCDFSLLHKDSHLISSLTALKENGKKSGLKVIAFSNGPRKYVLKVLDVLGLGHIFPDDSVFAVDDILPYCKPEREAFEKILSNISDNGDAINFNECVMVEDSMKNIQAAKELGMKTILITGSNIDDHHDIDRPNVTDPSIDVCLKSASEMERMIPGLWENPALFAIKGDKEHMGQRIG